MTGPSTSLFFCFLLIVCSTIVCIQGARNKRFKTTKAIDIYENITSSCTFLNKWHGEYFQSSDRKVISINETTMTSHSSLICLSQKNFEKYMYYGWDSENQYYFRTCVAIFELDTNILEYKEGSVFDDNRTTLDDVCNSILGDASMIYLYRIDGKSRPIICPLKPPYQFTYKRNAKECTVYKSRIERCADDTRILLRFQACPDTSLESFDVELQCWANWIGNGKRVLTVKRMAPQMEAKHPDPKSLSLHGVFRCLIIISQNNDDSSIESMVTSTDASCSELSNPREGNEVLTLDKEPRDEIERNYCQFPAIVTELENWKSVSKKKGVFFDLYKFKGSEGFIDHGNYHTVMKCLTLETSYHRLTSKFTVDILSGCRKGFACLLLRKLDTHVVEVQLSGDIFRLDSTAVAYSYKPSKKCFILYLLDIVMEGSFERVCVDFDTNFIPNVTLVSSPKQCPFSGQWKTKHAEVDEYYATSSYKNEFNLIPHCYHAFLKDSTDKTYYKENGYIEYKDWYKLVTLFPSLDAGCGDHNETDLKINSTCAAEFEAFPALDYTCYGNWIENDTTFFLAELNDREEYFRFSMRVILTKNSRDHCISLQVHNLLNTEKWSYHPIMKMELCRINSCPKYSLLNEVSAATAFHLALNWPMRIILFISMLFII